MNKRGFGIASMLGLIFVFAICLCLSALSYQRFLRDDEDEPEEIPVSKGEVKTSIISEAYDYTILENRLSEASKAYIKVTHLEDSLSLVIPSNDLLNQNYLTDFYDLADSTNLCVGYVIYKSSEYTPYIWCKGSYATEGFDVNYK